MADKLSNIAKKFYPVQEDEVERLGTASPVIQVFINLQTTCLKQVSESVKINVINT